jgi:periplasmic protein TonB
MQILFRDAGPLRICLARDGAAVVHMTILPFAFRRPREFKLDMRDPASRGPDPGTTTPKGVGLAPIDAALAPKIPPPARPLEYYKSRSLAASNWGALVASGQPLRHVTSEEAQETVLRNLLDTPMSGGRRSPLEWTVSLLIHVAIVTALIVIPLLFTQAISSTDLQATYLSLPPPPAAAPPPSPPDLPVRRSFRHIPAAALMMPTVIPKRIVQIKDEDAPDIGGGGVAGGIAGGENGGVLGGILGGMPSGPPPPRPPASKKTVYRVGGDVKPPRQLVRVNPVYPLIAQKAHAEGTVEIDAVIDEQGNVSQARAVSGPKFLMAAALEAVLKWKYEPTYLDGMPVSLNMQVEVTFHWRAGN